MCSGPHHKHRKCHFSSIGLESSSELMGSVPPRTQPEPMRPRAGECSKVLLPAGGHRALCGCRTGCAQGPRPTAAPEWPLCRDTHPCALGAGACCPAPGFSAFNTHICPHARAHTCTSAHACTHTQDTHTHTHAHRHTRAHSTHTHMCLQHEHIHAHTHA